MALTKQNAAINFAQGVDRKTDPFQVQLGRFLELENCVFNKSGLFQKRNGYGALPSLPDATAEILTTFQGDLTAIGTSLRAYSQNAGSWISRGSIIPAELSVMTAVRNNTNQSQCDSAVAPNGLICTVYADQDPTSLSTLIFRYTIQDGETGQVVVSPASLSDADATYGYPKVFAVGNYFVIVYTNKVVSTYHLKYVAINSVSLVVGSATDVSTSYAPATTGAFDGATYNGALYLAWNGAAASGIKMASLTSALVLSSVINPDAAHVATHVAVCADAGRGTIWVAYYDSGTTNGYVLARSAALTSVLAATAVITTVAVANISVVAQSGSATVFYEVTNAYSYDSTVASNFVRYRTCTEAGSLGTATTLLRSVGLGSKAFILGGSVYVLLVYSSPYQPTYFLSNSSGNLIAKLAYSNGGGYLTHGLPSVAVDGSTALVAYLIRDLVQAVNKDTNVASGTQTAGIYTQTGINLATFALGGGSVVAEIGQNLNLAGGFLWAYDGSTPVEQGFHLYPDSAKAATQADPTPTGNTTNGSPNIASLSSVAGLAIGMTVTGTGIPASTTVLSLGTTTAVLSKNATATGTGVTLTFTGSQAAQKYYYQWVYEWTDNQGNCFQSAPSIPVTVTTSAGNSSVVVYAPTLRATYKTANPVKLVLYRWSTAQPVYYQATYLATPVLNSTSTDSVSFIDVLPDSTILGNRLLYTTGGVVENIGGPACSSTFLFDDRLWLIASEDGNLWFSKQVLAGTPADLSDLLTKYVAPNVGAQGPSGKLLCGAPMDDKAVLFKASSLLYFSGTGPDQTGANNQYSEPALITSTVGCSNQSSIIFTPMGLLFEFQSDAGNQIWLLGRDLSTKYIGSPVEDFTLDATVQSAVNVPGTNQVRFTLSSGITVVFDYFYGQWFTFVGVPAVSSTLFQGLHTYINSSGQAFQETPMLYVDGGSPVLMKFSTSWINLAGLQGYQRAYYFFLLATFLSPHKLAVSIAYDYSPYPSQQFTISPDNWSGTYGDDPFWGVSDTFGGVLPKEQWRCSLNQQKCQAFQLTVQELFDSSKGTAPGAGFSMSGINVVYGAKKGYPRLPPSRQVG